MAKSISIALGNHFKRFIDAQIESGRYGSASEVIRASLRLLQERERRVRPLSLALIEGEESGDAGELDMRRIKARARRC